MRRTIRITALAIGTCFLTLGAAGAADRYEPSTEGRAYISLSFGGERLAPRDLHYGLRFDQDRRFYPEQTAPLMQFDFTARGMNDLRVNGLSVLRADFRMRQAEGATSGAAEAPPEEPAAEEEVAEDEPAEEAPAEEASAGEVGEDLADGGEAAGEEEGFFEGIASSVGGFFGGLFGGGEEEEAPAAEDMAETTDEVPPDEIAEGTFMSFNAIDWGLLAIGAVGLGYAVSEVSNGDDDPTLVDADGDGVADPPGGGGGGSGVACLIPPNQIDPDGFPDGCDPNAFAGRQSGGTFLGVDVDYQEWLDGGTGHMGDLGG